MRVDVVYTFRCSVEGCNVTDVRHHSDVSSYRIPAPWEPSGWTEAGRLLLCPRHTLMLEVDGEKVPVRPEESAAPPPPTSA
jgi:hypothetical protein